MADNMDMFTRLKDVDIVIILSLLPFKEAARTSILSKRWRDMWRATKNIEFIESFFVNPRDTEEERELKRRVFINFARRWSASYPGSSVSKFLLSLSKPGSFPDDVVDLTTFAISRNVKEISLDFSEPSWGEENQGEHDAVFNLPNAVYQHRQLESLTLFSCNSVASQFAHLTALKNLSLGWIPLTDETLQSTLRFCPLLESLTLKKCWNIQYLEINGEHLKEVVVDGCNFLADPYLSFGVPKLKFFKYSGKCGQFFFDDVGIVDKAVLDFGLETEFEEIGIFLYDLLYDLSTARVLTVDSYLLQVITTGEEPVRMQAPLHVQHLILKTALHQDEFTGISFMLHSCRHLETLTIDLVPPKIFPDYDPPYQFRPEEFWCNEIIRFKCLLRTLKVVLVKGFKGTWSEMHVVKYLLSHGKVLRSFDVYISKEIDDSARNVALLRANVVTQQRYRVSRYVHTTVHN